MQGKVPIMEDINLEIKRGELIAVIGPVGAGKVISGARLRVTRQPNVTTPLDVTPEHTAR